jgi:ABC-2 type transport system permease protein
MKKMQIVMMKEWAQVFRNRLVLSSVIFLPLLMTAIPLGILVAVRSEGELATVQTEMPEQINAFCPAGLNGGECFQVYMVSQFMLMFMILPLAIPATIAAYSVVGEKTARTLEPLLATPISTTELLMGKSLAGVLPGVLATYLAFGVFIFGAWLLIPNPQLFNALLDGRWLIAIFITGPLMALMAVNFSIMVSSRASDPRVAEQLSMLVILPLMLLFFGQLAGLFVINRAMIWSITGLLLVLDAVLVYLAVQVFERENVLTRWSA